jgi:RNA polymerase sigma-70 factor (ECF subfamily)
MSKKKKFARIYKDNINIVYRYIYARLFDKSKAEDMTSKTFEIAYNKFLEPDMEELDNPKTWLIQIARNVMGNYIQKKKMRGPAVEDLNLPNDDDPLLQQAISQEQIEDIRKYFEELDGDAREVITLKIWEGYKFREIAEITGLNKSTAKSLYYRGLKKIRKSMKDKEREKKEYAVVIAGLSALKSTSAFTPSTAFAKAALTKISVEAAQAAGSIMSNLFTKSITLFGKTFTVRHLFVGTTVVVAGLGAVGGGAVYYTQSQRDSMEQQDSDSAQEREYREVEEVEEDEEWEEKTLEIKNLPSDNVVKSVSVKLPEDAEVSYEDWGNTSAAIISYEGSEMHFSLPDGIIPNMQEFSDYDEIDNDNIGTLYRVTSQYAQQGGTYVDELEEEGTCKGDLPEEEKLEAPCGNFNVEGILIGCSNESNDYSFCDKVMESFSILDVNDKKRDDSGAEKPVFYKWDMKYCESEHLSVSLEVPTDWTCTELNESYFRLIGDGFDIGISNAGRGAPCIEENADDQPGCSAIYSNSTFTIYMNSIDGVNQEIFGMIGEYTYVTGVYKEMEERDLTQEEQDLLKQIFDSIEVN